MKYYCFICGRMFLALFYELVIFPTGSLRSAAHNSWETNVEHFLFVRHSSIISDTQNRLSLSLGFYSCGTWFPRVWMTPIDSWAGQQTLWSNASNSLIFKLFWLLWAVLIFRVTISYVEIDRTYTEEASLSTRCVSQTNLNKRVKSNVC